MLKKKSGFSQEQAIRRMPHGSILKRRVSGIGYMWDRILHELKQEK